jgi:hypothetical protein
LIQALSKTRGAKATNKTDKVFSLLGLSYDGKIILPAPNYQLGHDQINLEMTKAFINMMKSLDMCVVMARPLVHDANDVTRRWYPDWFCDDTWMDQRRIQYVTARKTSPSLDIDYLNPEAKYGLQQYNYISPRITSDYIISRAIIIDEIDGIALIFEEVFNTHLAEALEKHSLDESHIYTESAVEEHFLPQIVYGDKIAHVACQILCPPSSSSSP